KRRFRKRLLKLLGKAGLPPGFDYALEAPTVRQGLDAALARLLKAKSDIRLVVVDTLGHVGLFQSRGNENAYAADLAFMRPLKRVADDFGVALLGLHHDRKAPDID